MSEYIERQEVYSEINKLPLTEDAAMEILWAVGDIPTADVAPVVHGIGNLFIPILITKTGQKTMNVPCAAGLQVTRFIHVVWILNFALIVVQKWISVRHQWII